jgi:hypothetical protein
VECGREAKQHWNQEQRGEMTRDERIDTEILALSNRMTALEQHIGLKTVICAGYCEQPTANPSGMCLACHAREHRIDAELRRRDRG